MAAEHVLVDIKSPNRVPAAGYGYSLLKASLENSNCLGFYSLVTSQNKQKVQRLFHLVLRTRDADVSIVNRQDDATRG